MSPAGLRALVLLSILAALSTIALKAGAYWLTGSVGLLSDVLESGINLFAALAAYLSLHYSQRPADASHAYGHEKIEFFSSGLEGGLIVAAGLGTAWVAVDRLANPQPLTDLALGTGMAVAASAINLVVGLVLVRVGRRERSIILEADGRHLLADVWTSAAVVAGIGVVWITGVHVLDPLIAIVVGLHILWTGIRLIRRSVDGLMDHALSPAELEQVRTAIRGASPAGTAFHALRTRQAGARKFADFHLLVPGSMSVRAAHDLAHAVEAAVREVVAGIEVTVHVEPIEDRGSYEDNALSGIEPEIPLPPPPPP